MAMVLPLFRAFQPKNTWLLPALWSAEHIRFLRETRDLVLLRWPNRPKEQKARMFHAGTFLR